MAKLVSRISGKIDFNLLVDDYRDMAHYMSPAEIAEEVIDDNRLSFNQQCQILEILGL